MNVVVKNGVSVVKTLIWNKTGNEADDDGSECQLTFNDGSSIKYECRDVDELEDKNKGIYELLSDETYVQVEDWQ